MAQGTPLTPTVRIRTGRAEESSGTPDSERSRARDALRRKMVRSKTPPPRLSHGTSEDCISPSSRPRLNSREYTHTYAGNYGAGNEDMVGVDLARTTGGWLEQQKLYIFLSYLVGFVVIWLTVAMVLTPADGAAASMTFTVTNVIHCAVHLAYLHWMKGGYWEAQGEMEHMTLWEQIEATPNTQWLRFGLRLVPTLLFYCACYEAEWESHVVAFNVIVIFLCLLGKFEWMNGVRLFRINQHPTIDTEKDD